MWHVGNSTFGEGGLNHTRIGPKKLVHNVFVYIQLYLQIVQNAIRIDYVQLYTIFTMGTGNWQYKL